MKILVVISIVVIGFIFARAMTHTGEFFLNAIKKSQEEKDREDWK